jgi:hypothetical protein
MSSIISIPSAGILELLIAMAILIKEGYLYLILICDNQERGG